MNIFNDSTFIGGHPVLDFINTVEDQDKQRNLNLIADWSSFVAWAQAAEIFSEEQLGVLNNAIPSVEKISLLVEIQQVKEETYNALNFILCSTSTENSAFKKLQCRIKTAISHASLVQQAASFSWQANTNNPNWVVDILLLRIEDFLCHTDMTKLRQCKGCSWMFLNSGRGKGRQWCNMKTCGNRAKLAAFRERRH